MVDGLDHALERSSMGSKDRLLETIQHNGGWMTPEEMEVEGHVNPEFVKECLKDFVGFQVVEEKDGKYKAIMEDQK